MMIDSHVHLMPERVRQDRTPFCEADPAFGSLYRSPKARLASESDILHYLDSSGIAKAVVFGFPWEDPELVRENNDEVWDFHRRAPDRIVPFAVLSSQGGEEACREAERTVGRGFAGLGELAVYQQGWTEDRLASLEPTLALAGTAGVPVMIHINEPVGHHYPGKVPVDFSALIAMIERNPEVDFILAHFGGGVFVYGLMPEIHRIFARTYLDTAASPFLYAADVYEIACRIMGVEKILFGSDFPLLGIARYLKEFEKGRISEPLRESILGGNMQRLLERNRAVPL
ncbi:MAG: amidohydrolase [Desulfomonile tiedjei]|nr:amidohydrolase [Desulfomonile tiedjei]